jgi:hypothetical protein
MSSIVRISLVAIHIRRNGHAHQKKWGDSCCGNSGSDLQGCGRQPADETEVLQHYGQDDNKGDNECDYENSAE